VALALDQYILRPPAHSQELLTNHQYDWLHGGDSFGGPDAVTSKWQALGMSGDDGVLAEAVARANLGQLVVAAFASTDRKKPGHICIVRRRIGQTTAKHRRWSCRRELSITARWI
jgi:hypothetical protein